MGHLFPGGWIQLRHKDVAMKLDTSYSDNGIFGPDYSFTLSFKLIPKIVTYETGWRRNSITRAASSSSW
jgi:hypothetical protein